MAGLGVAHGDVPGGAVVVSAGGSILAKDHNRREERVGLPVHIGIPGVAEPHRLLAIAARIGVADTHRFLSKNVRFVARMARSGGFYKPDGLLDGLAPTVADAAADIVDLHLYTFNQVAETEAWRQDLITRLRER